MRKTSGFSRMAPTIASLRASLYVTSSLGIDVLQGRFGVVCRITRGPVEGLLYTLLHLFLQVPPLALLQGALLFEDGGEALYRVALAPRRDLLAGAVEVRVALGVAEVTVGDRLKKRRPLPRARGLWRLPRGPRRGRSPRPLHPASRMLRPGRRCSRRRWPS